MNQEKKRGVRELITENTWKFLLVTALLTSCTPTEQPPTPNTGVVPQFRPIQIIPITGTPFKSLFPPGGFPPRKPRQVS